ncbi:hypothetical protein [uncultured Piscinibacter sp.]|uniref:hypothetical protein n=1 Tax=uncultured Piscinibacter sp. TaxID=1131835 RepID=UPI00345C0CBF
MSPLEFMQRLAGLVARSRLQLIRLHGVLTSTAIAALLERPVIEKILSHLGLNPQPPPKGRAREPVHFAA